MSSEKDARKYWLQENYEQAAQNYELAIQANPENLFYYWYLGLAYLLQHQEDLAQMIWFLPMEQGTDAEVQHWIQQLNDILELEAQRQASTKNFKNCWLIRQHIKEICADNIHNILELIFLSSELSNFEISHLEEYKIINLLKYCEPNAVNSDLLLKVLTLLLKTLSPESLDFLNVSLRLANSKDKWIIALTEAITEIAGQDGQIDFSIRAIEIYLVLDPLNASILQQLCLLYNRAMQLCSRALKSLKGFV